RGEARLQVVGDHPREESHPAVAGALGREKMGEEAGDVANLHGKLVLLRPHLLHAHDRGGLALQPLAKALGHAGAKPVDVPADHAHGRISTRTRPALPLPVAPPRLSLGACCSHQPTAATDAGPRPGVRVPRSPTSPRPRLRRSSLHERRLAGASNKSRKARSASPTASAASRRSVTTTGSW